MVYVIDIHGKPLMPTARHGKVRRLLQRSRAHVVRLMPFTIQLDYETTSYTQDISLGIDSGSKYIGLSASTEKKELFSAECNLRDDIVEKISTRRELRRTRRSRKLRHRKARFNNRTKKEDWLAPSQRYKIDSHMKIIRMIYSILPVTVAYFEGCQFDIQKIKNPDIYSKEYQHGEQYSSWNIREYVLYRDNHTCQCCHGKSKDRILNVHHIESRKTGGNAPNNLITLCKTCHDLYHNGKVEFDVKRGRSFRDAASASVIKNKIFERMKQEFHNVHMTYGYITKSRRIENNIEKSHHSDAYCIAGNLKAERLESCMIIKLLQRHTRVLHVCKPNKGGKRRSAVAPHLLGKTSLQR